MSITNHIAASDRTRISYRIEHRDGCVIVDGSIPVSDFAAITSLGGPHNVVSPELSKLLGVTMAFGPPESVTDLLQRTREQRLANPANFAPVAHLDAGTQRWFVAGEHGTSSVVMFCWITRVQHNYLDGMPFSKCRNHPSDPADFRRCRLLVEASPEVAAAFRTVMPTVSPVWSDLIAHWDELCEVMDAECPDWKTAEGIAPRTYELMSSIRYNHDDA